MRDLSSQLPFQFRQAWGNNFSEFCHKKRRTSQVVVVHALNRSTQEAKEGESLSVRGQPGLQREF